MLLSGRDVLVIFVSYTLGCLCGGYYLVRLFAGEDVRRLGSTNVGARNVGRILGPIGFVITFLIDLTKGALAVLVAKYFNLELKVVMLAMVAVVAGHIWPFQLRFKGGKGVATVLGAGLIFDWGLTTIIVVLFLPLFAFTRQFTLSGLIAIAMTPGVAALTGCSGTVIAGITALSLLILFAHRKNIRDIVMATTAK